MLNCKCDARHIDCLIKSFVDGFNGINSVRLFTRLMDKAWKRDGTLYIVCNGDKWCYCDTDSTVWNIARPVSDRFNVYKVSCINLAAYDIETEFRFVDVTDNFQ